MSCDYVLLSLVGITTCFMIGTVGRVSIIDGEKATAAQFPYQVSVQINNGVHDCGGGIIAPQFGLTAAHCVLELNRSFKQEDFSVLAGTNDWMTHEKTAVSMDVVKIYVLEEFDPKKGTSEGDIAVLKLKHPLTFSKNIHKLDLPKSKDEKYTGKTAKIAGWGWNWISLSGSKIHAGGYRDYQLRYAEVDVLDKSHKYYDDDTIADKEMYAQVKQRDPKNPTGVCHGDSGGILVYGNTAIGILSRSPWDCYEDTSPSVYTRVARYLHFIHEAMHDNKHDFIRLRVIDRR